MLSHVLCKPHEEFDLINCFTKEKANIIGIQLAYI